jgi:REP-associated tyrosine transposase
MEREALAERLRATIAGARAFQASGCVQTQEEREAFRRAGARDHTRSAKPLGERGASFAPLSCMKHRRPRKLDPTLYIGPHRIFFTMCTLDRRRSFSDPAIVEPAREELLRTSTRYGVELTAYVFMPDHLHGLIVGLAGNSDLLECMERFRRLNGFAHKRQHVDRLWQEGYDDRFLRAEEDTLNVAAYIVANPIRAGLCKDIRKYPYLGSSRYTIEELIDAIALLPTRSKG